MMRRTVLCLAMTAILGASTTAPAQQVYSDVCWTVNGWPLKTSLTLAGTAAGSYVFDMDGYGTTTKVPIKGTLIVPPTGDVRLSFSIQAASPDQSAVMHELTLSRTTLGGTGSYRWFDTTHDGTTTAILVLCTAAAPARSEDRASEGLR